MDRRMIAAAAAAVLLLSGCSMRQDVTAIKTRAEELGTTDAETTDAEQEESSSAVSSSSSAEEESSSSKDESVTEEKEEVPKVRREAVDYDIEDDYSFVLDDFEKVYSNEELEECFDKLQEICDDADFPLSFSYMNVDTGAYVGYRREQSYMTCSCIKAPVIKSLLEDDIDVNETVSRTYTWEGDGGTVASSEYGTEYTVKELMEYSIIESDNTAYYMLCRHCGVNAFNNMQYKLDSRYTLGWDWIFTYCTTDDMLKDYVDIYEYGEDAKRGEWLIDKMTKCKTNIQIGEALGEKYKVAQKYGSEFSEHVFNDCAIVYADSPFVLCIFTNQTPETEESCRVFKDLALVFDDINSLIAAPEE